MKWFSGYNTGPFMLSKLKSSFNTVTFVAFNKSILSYNAVFILEYDFVVM